MTEVFWIAVTGVSICLFGGSQYWSNFTTER
jgi:hypothetical protein